MRESEYNDDPRPKPSGGNVRVILKRDNEEKYKYQSKKRLTTNIHKKFTTTMIGALAAFEKHFGHIWENDPRWRDTWENARTEVLDVGNKNLRAAEQEISEYTITWDRHTTEFRFDNITRKDK